MKNVTLGFDEQILSMGRARAHDLGTSFNAYVRELIAQDINGDGSWVHSLFDFMDQHPLRTPDVTWTREELHERPV